ncbi:hypothetical protein FSOLCH5_003847 [Fusarium solani]|uniref:Uncharacterized protein n=1 Tax=Fusarium solani TaxID=169388 RepID=A0A9P9KY60_FUSSL|nr:uncharacterized protein B0J15DRAFT_575875 [Fusarium solani]KAH7270975.1 hypothetical protein B0J15DRAFT_575875 [Fusarium solani]KAJ3467688.1 hypothetical protein MRS44_005252 [Fusarium solani]KAJ4234658.1 hypothetical protein NW759_001649 [Fusarium solani]
MKFSAVALLTLAHGILAMPQISDKTNEMAKRSAQTHNQDICLRICWFEEPRCPEGWYANQQGECWTCCRGTGEEK